MNFFSIDLYGENLFIGLEFRFNEKVLYCCIGQRQNCKSFKIPASKIFDENWHNITLKFNGVQASVHIDDEFIEQHGEYTTALVRGEENFKYIITLDGKNVNMNFKTIKLYSGIDTLDNQRLQPMVEPVRRGLHSGRLI